MRCIGLLAAFSLRLASIVVADELTQTNAEKSAALSLGVIQPGDIGIHRMFRGRPLPQTLAVYLLHNAQLELYRRTVQDHGDAALTVANFQSRDEYMSLNLDIKPFGIGENHMTLGSSFYGIYAILKTMLLPRSPADGFWELKWRIWNRALIPGREVPLGYLSLLIGGAEAVHNVTFNSAPSAPTFTASLDPPPSSPNGLSAPFPVPETDITLLIGPRGVELTQTEVVLTLNSLMSTAWQNVAVNHRAQPVRERTWYSPLRDRVSVTLRPRMIGTTRQVDDTDLAEAAFGLVYYFLLHQPAFATNVTIVKPNEGGRRIPIGEIEIRRGQPRVEIGGSENGASVKTS